MGHGAWGMGHGAWGMEKSDQCPMPYAQSRRAAVPLHPLLGWSFPPTSNKPSNKHSWANY
jgi:hypothetical protein